MYTYINSRHYAQSSQDCETLDEAIERGCADLDCGCVWPIKIEKNGVAILSHETLMTIIQNVRIAKELREDSDETDKR